MAMEDDEGFGSSETISLDVNKVLQSSISYLSKKRKLQAEQLGLPLPKHTCCNRSSSPECDSIIKEKNDESEPESAVDSNSISDDMDSSTSLTAEAKVECAKMHDSPSTLSSDSWGTGSSTDKLYSLDGRLLVKSGAGIVQSEYIGRDRTFPSNDFGLRTCLNFDDELLLGYGCHADHLDNGDKNIEQSSNKEIENALYSDGAPTTNCDLPSERWLIEQEIQSTDNKLTIDKEFEQYFSMLML